MISLPETKEDKQWFKEHKVTRKADEKRVQAEHKAKVAEDRKAEKLALKAQQSSLADVDEE